MFGEIKLNSTLVLSISHAYTKMVKEKITYWYVRKTDGSSPICDIKPSGT
jgi:hypothetical protein